LKDDLRRLAASCLLPGFEGTEPPDWLVRWIERGVGGVTLFTRNIVSEAQVASLNGTLRELNPNLVIAVDEEGGDVTRLEAGAGSSVPGNRALGEVNDPELTEAIAAGIGTKLRAAGVNLNFAPVADVLAGAGSPAIGVRSFGSDPALVAIHTAAYVRGLQSQRVMACAKHFPGHGSVTIDSHLEPGTLSEDGEELRAHALAPFRAAIEAGVKAIMTAHLRVRSYGDLPATLNRGLITDLLRTEMGFQGAVVTDALEMGAISRTVGIAQGAVLAMAAGADLICIAGEIAGPEIVDELVSALVEAVEVGRIPIDRMEAAAARVQTLIDWTKEPVTAELPNRPNAGREAARGALRGSGNWRITGGPIVIELESAGMIAAGAVPWGVGAQLAVINPGTTVIRLRSTAPVHPLLSEAAGHSLIVACRDFHLHPWALGLTEELLTVRPDAMVLEMGIPALRPIGATNYLATYGASRVSAEAAIEILTGSQPIVRRADSSNLG
jgi:beta-N-acetylhexosaminidase